MKRTALACFVTLGGCASVLGGLEEGSPRMTLDAGKDGAPDADAGACAWLDDFEVRIPFKIDHRGPELRGYQVKLVLPTSALVRDGKLGADGRDLAVTAADGVARVPHWIENGIGTDETTVWMRLDLGEEPVTGWIYVGSPTATNTGSSDRVFEEGLIENPRFDGERGWSQATRGELDPGKGDQWELDVKDGRARLSLARKPRPNGATIGICQTFELPGERPFRLRFDVEVALLERANAVVVLDTDDEAKRSLWTAEGASLTLGRRRAETIDIARGHQTLCFTVGVAGGGSSQAISVSYSNLHFRRYVDGDRTARVSGAEARRCER